MVGVDVGIKTLAVTSDGQEHGNPRCYQRGERKLRRINKAIARSIQLKPQPAHQSTGATLCATGDGCNPNRRIAARLATGKLHPR